MVMIFKSTKLLLLSSAVAISKRIIVLPSCQPLNSQSSIIIKNFVQQTKKNIQNWNLSRNYQRKSITVNSLLNGWKYNEQIAFKNHYRWSLFCSMSTIVPPGKNKPDIEKKPLNRIYTIPNILCMARILATPLAGYLIIQTDFQTAFAVCVLSSMTDFLDGWLARNFNLESKLGSILDPLADKLLVVTLTITLTYMQMIPFFLAGLIFLRDFLILLGAFWMRFQMVQRPITFKKYFDMSTFSSDRYRPTWISKMNTGFQFSLVLITLASPLFDGFFIAYPVLLPLLQWTTGITTLWSGLDYIKRLNITRTKC